MASETELERLVVRIVGDMGQYTSMLTQAQQATNQAAAQVQAAAARVEGFGTSLKGFAAGVGGALASLGVLNFLGGAREAYEQSEKVQLRLRAAIEANGGAVETTMAAYKQFAKETAAVASITGGAVLALAQTAESYGLTGDQAERAIRNSVALASVKGGEAAEYLRVAAALEQGHVMVRAISPALTRFKEGSERAAEAQALLARWWKVAESDGRTNEAQVKRLWATLAGLKKEIGSLVSGAVQPVIAAMQQAATWFQNLDPAVRKMIVSVGALTASWLAFAPVLRFIGPSLGLALGPVKLLGAALAAIPSVAGILGTAGLGAAAAGIAVFVNRMGGLSAAWGAVKSAAGVAWDWIQARVAEFVAWAEPIGKALASFFTTAWDLIKVGVGELWDWSVTAFGSVRDFVAEVWASISGSALPTWTTVRDAIVTAILAGEFALKNFKAVADVAWTGALYGAVRFGNQVEYFFTTVMPTTLDWFAENWRDIFRDIYEYTTNVIGNLVGNIGNIFSNLPALISGKLSFSDLWRPLTEGFQRATKELVIPDRVIGDMEEQIRKEFDRSSAALGQSFDAFKRQRLAEFGKLAAGAIPPALKDPKAGKGPWAGYGEAAKAATEAVQKFDAAAFGSAEHLQRLQEYHDRIRGPFQQAATAATGAASAAATAAGGGWSGDTVRVAVQPSANVTAAGGGGKDDKILERLTQIRDEVKKPAVEIKAWA